MRNTIIGIVIGVVVGVMAGTTMVAPNLEEARTSAAQSKPDPQSSDKDASAESGVEKLELEATPSVPVKPVRAAVSTLRIISAFPIKTPILGELPQRMKQRLPHATGGRVQANIFDPGTLVDDKDTLAAVKSGTVEAAYAPPGQWDTEDPVLQLFTAVPFGPEAPEYLSWFYYGGGEKLFQEHMKTKGVHALLCGAIPAEASGWFRTPVRTLDDFQGLNVRASGLGGNVLQKIGVNVRTLNAGEILAQFELGDLDGAEYSLPSIDAKLGFQKFARNYYFPAWHQPLTLFALAVNAKTWNKLTQADRLAVRTVCGDTVRYALTRAEAEQFEALKDLGLSGIQVRRWSTDIMEGLESAWKDVVRERVSENKAFATTWESLQKFRRDYAIWREISRF